MDDKKQERKESADVALKSSVALALVPRTIDEAISLAGNLAKAQTMNLMLRGKPADVLAIILAGQELGLSPMASMRSISVIDGKPSLSADLMVAVARKSGICEYVIAIEETDDCVTIETKRKGEPQRRCTWTAMMAKTAGLLGKDNWRKYPRAMLASRAKAELMRNVYPDVLAGCYTDEETESFSKLPYQAQAPFHPAMQDDVVDAELIESAPSEPVAPSDKPLPAAEITKPVVKPAVIDPLKSPLEAIAAASDSDATALKNMLAKLPQGKLRDEARAAFYARWPQPKSTKEAA